MNRSNLRALSRQVATVGLALAAMAAGLVLGSSGCGWRCDCPELEPIEPGVFEIVASPDRPELIGGVVDASAEVVEIRHVDAVGDEWVIEYRIVEKVEG